MTRNHISTAVLAFLAAITLSSCGNVSPLKFEGSDTERIQAAVDAAVGKKVVIPKQNPRGGDIWEIDRAITLPSHTTLILDGCTLQLTDASRDNMFRSANVGEGIKDPGKLEDISIIGRNGATLRGADNPRSTGDSRRNLSTGDFSLSHNPGWNSYGTDAGKEGLKQRGDWRNIMILLAYVDGVRMEGFRLENGHCWAISFERVLNADLTNLELYSPEVRVIDGKRKSVFNADGIDLREGCKHFNISNIKAVTGDDPIALSALQGGKGESGDVNSTMVTSKPHTGPEDDIEDIHISNIMTDCRGVTIRSSDSAGIHHIYIDNLTSSPIEGVTSLSRPFVILLGNTNYGNPADAYAIHDIYISNVRGAGSDFIQVKSAISDISVTDCTYDSPSGKDLITYLVDPASCRNISVESSSTLRTQTYGKAIPVGRAWSVSFPAAGGKRFFTDTLALSLARFGVGSDEAEYSSAIEIADTRAADGWFLDLGVVRGRATVTLNGEVADEVFGADAHESRIDVTRLLRPGVNLLEIRIKKLDDKPFGLFSGVSLIPVYNPLPSSETVIAQTRLVNDRFMKMFEDPSKPVPFPSRHKTYEGNIWTRGVYFEGLMSLYAADSQSSYLDYARRWGETFGWNMRNGEPLTRNADNYCCSQTYIDLYRIFKDPAMIANVKTCMENILSTDESDADWTWIDAIQMGMPVLVKYGVTAGRPEFFEKAWKMYKWARDRFWNPEDGLWWRDASFCPPYTTPGGKDCYWARGNGWVLAAYMRVLDELPQDAPHRDVYEADFKAMCEALVSCQRPDGTWNCSLEDPEDFGGPEATGTSLFISGLSWGLRTGMLDHKTYLPVISRVWNGLQRICIHEDGFIGYSQGTGKEPKEAQPLSYDRIPDFEDFGTGCYLLAGSQAALLSRFLEENDNISTL